MTNPNQPSTPTGSPSRPIVRVVTSPRVRPQAASAPTGSQPSSSSILPMASGLGVLGNNPDPNLLSASVTRTTSNIERTPTITGLTPTSGLKTTPPKSLSSPSGSDRSNELTVVDNKWCVDRKQEIQKLQKKVKKLYNKVNKDDVKIIQTDLQEFVRKLEESSSTRITSQTSTELTSLLKTAQDVGQDLYKIFKPIKNSHWRIPLIEYVEQIMRFAGTRFLLNPRLLVQFASTCQTHFSRWGILAIDHIDIAITNLSDLLPRFTNTDYLDLLGALTALYGMRYYQFGDPVDHTRAVELGLKACKLTAKSSPSWVSRNIELALVYLAKAKRTDQAAHETVTDAIQHAFDLLKPISPTPSDEGWTHLCETLAWKCHFVVDNHDTLCELKAQLTKASTLKSSFSSNQNPTAHEAAHLAALAFSYLTLYEKENKVDNLKIATEYYVKATNSKVIDKQHPDRCSWLIGLGRAYNYACEYNNAHEQEDALEQKDPVDCFRAAALLAYAMPTKRMDACRKWAKVVPEANLVEVYQNMLDIVPRLVGLEQTLPHRIANIKMVVDLAQKATRAAIQGNNLHLALEFAERGRGIFFQSAFEVRVLLFLPEFLELQSKHPIRAKYLKQSIDNLKKSENLLRLDPTEKPMPGYRRHAAKYAKQVGELWKFPMSNLAGFLHPISKKLVQAARDRHIIIINALEDSLNISALVIKKGGNEPNHVPLNFPNQVFHEIRDKLVKAGLTRQIDGSERRGAARGVGADQTANGFLKRALGALWKVIVKPILQHLGCTLQVINDISDVEKLPRITWCLTGGLASLPIHATGDYNTPGSQERLYNYAISSYTPTLRALLTPAPSSTPKRQKIFIAAMEKTPKIPGILKGTIEEMSSIVGLARQFNIPYTTLQNDQATINNVLEELTACTSAHLGCHGIQDLLDPIKSHLALNDGDLTAERLMQLGFEPKDLAFLSACETAKGDPRMPNEAIHLALIMMLLGFRAVIATLWAVKDADCPIVTEEFYRRVMKNGEIDLKRVPIALHMALHVLRTKIQEHEFKRWTCYVHIGV